MGWWRRRENLVVGAYIAAALMWILLSDRILLSLSRDPADLAFWGILKGFLFVAVSSLLLLVLLRSMVGRVERADRRAREAEEREKEMAEAAERKRRLEGLGRIAAGVAHDLANLLEPIHLALERARENRRPLDGRELGVVRDMVRRGAAMARAMVEFGIGNEALSFRIAPVAEEVVHIARLEAGPGSSVLCEGSLRESVHADPEGFHRALLNLVRNGIASAAGPRRVLVSWRRDPGDEGRIEVAVEDDGPGFRPVALEEGERSRPGGHGLGLANVVDFCRLAEGRVEVSRSAALGGARVVLRLPSAPAQEESVPVPAMADDPDVLVVEDEAAIRGFVQEWLETCGLRVAAVASGMEAAAFLEPGGRAPRAVVLDWWLGDSSAMDLSRALRERDPGIRIVAISGRPLSAEELASAGIDRFLLKPFSGRELGEALDAGRG